MDFSIAPTVKTQVISLFRDLFSQSIFESNAKYGVKPGSPWTYLTETIRCFRLFMENVHAGNPTEYLHTKSAINVFINYIKNIDVMEILPELKDKKKRKETNKANGDIDDGNGNQCTTQNVPLLWKDVNNWGWGIDANGKTLQNDSFNTDNNKSDLKRKADTDASNYSTMGTNQKKRLKPDYNCTNIGTNKNISYKDLRIRLCESIENIKSFVLKNASNKSSQYIDQSKKELIRKDIGEFVQDLSLIADKLGMYE